MGNAFIAGLKNEAPRGRDITNEDRNSEESEAPSVMPKGPSLVTNVIAVTPKLTRCFDPVRGRTC